MGLGATLTNALPSRHTAGILGQQNSLPGRCKDRPRTRRPLSLARACQAGPRVLGALGSADWLEPRQESTWGCLRSSGRSHSLERCDLQLQRQRLARMRAELHAQRCKQVPSLYSIPRPRRPSSQQPDRSTFSSPTCRCRRLLPQQPKRPRRNGEAFSQHSWIRSLACSGRYCHP